VLGLGAGAGLVLAGPIEDHLGYAWLFLVPMIVGAITTVAAYFAVPESPTRLPGRIGWQPVVLLSGWLVALLVGVSKAPDWGWLSARVLGLIVVATVLAAFWIRVENRSQNPLVDMRMMRIPAVRTSNVIALLLGIVLYASFAFIPQFVETPASNGYGFGASVTEAGFILLPQAVAVFLTGLIVSQLVLRFGAKRLVVTALAIVVVPFLLLSFAPSETWEVVLATALFGTGAGLAFATLPNIIVSAVPPSQTGVATGMNGNIRNIGGAIGTAVVSTIVTSTAVDGGFPTEAGYRWGFAILAIASLMAVIAALLIPSAEATRRARLTTDPALGHAGGG
jgi:MFS family permease